MSRFDWCVHDKHRDCPGSVIRFTVNNRNQPETIGTLACECKCHERK